MRVIDHKTIRLDTDLSNQDNETCLKFGSLLSNRGFNEMMTNLVKVKMNRRTLKWLYLNFNKSEQRVSPAASSGSLSRITGVLNTCESHD